MHGKKIAELMIYFRKKQLINPINPHKRAKQPLHLVVSPLLSLIQARSKKNENPCRFYPFLKKELLKLRILN